MNLEDSGEVVIFQAPQFVLASLRHMGLKTPDTGGSLVMASDGSIL